jgi:Uma2 family endonuclease
MTTVQKEAIPMVIPADLVPEPRQGNWTYDHYATLPEDGKRYEIMDGVLLMAPSPTGSHQMVAGRFFYYLLNHVDFAGLGRVYQAPFDVELAPDVLVLLNAGLEKYTEKRIIGAPDLLVEVGSPGTAAYDRLSKSDAYAQAGVSEYWIANPERRTVEVLVLEKDNYRSLGIFWGKTSLPSHVVPGIADIHVEQFFS